MKRFIVEFGLGMDFHGQDVNRAAQKAVQDAISKSCLCGLSEILELDDLRTDVQVHVTVAVSRPELVDALALAEYLPVGKVEVEAVTGGLTAPGLYLPCFGDQDDSIEVAVAMIEVGVKSE